MLKVKKYDLIFSLGEMCSATQTLRYNSLQLASYPLDWVAELNLAARTELFINNFSNFFEKESFEYITYVKTNDCNVYRNKDNKLVFNHDFPAKIDFDTAYKNAKEKYDRRIKRLFENIDKADTILILFLEKPTKDHELVKKEDIIASFNKISEKYPDKKIDFLYITNNEHDNNKVEKLNDRITYISHFYKNKKAKEDIAVKIKLLDKIFNQYALNKPDTFIIKRKIQRTLISLIPNRKIKKHFRKKLHFA